MTVQKKMEILINKSCQNGNTKNSLKELHIALIQKYYNASDVSIDYHRQRVNMNILFDDSSYNPKSIHNSLDTFPVNLLFNNLGEFLKTCIEDVHKHVPFYTELLKTYNTPRVRELA